MNAHIDPLCQSALVDGRGIGVVLRSAVREALLHLKSVCAPLHAPLSGY